MRYWAYLFLAIIDIACAVVFALSGDFIWALNGTLAAIVFLLMAASALPDEAVH